MQLYHHPFSLESQRVRLALEERGIDYTSYSVNPITAKNMDSSFFRTTPTAKLPVFQNGSHMIFNTIEIIKYIERIASVSSGSTNTSTAEVSKWMKKIHEWNHSFFTATHMPNSHHLFISRFQRRVIIARMAESPDLASAYHRKLREAYEIEEKMRDGRSSRLNEEHLIRILDEVEAKLNETRYLGGDEFSMADVMLIPVLARLVLLKLKDEYIATRPRVAEYWSLVQRRPSYEKVIGRYFNGWRKYKTLTKTWFFLYLRNALKRY